MMHDVLHGDLAAAITDNVFLLVGIPMLAGWLLLRLRSGKSAVANTGGGDCRHRDAGLDGGA